MNATLNIYKDCTSEKPTKTFTCRRLTLGVSKKVQSLSDKMVGKTEEEQEQITIEILKSIFPDFETDDFNGLDPTEYLRFVNEIQKETTEIIENAAKN